MTKLSQPVIESTEACFSGGGEMGALMRAKDWSQTALGPVETWPQSLKIVIRIMLTSRYAMWMGWGPELTFFYNDSYRRETLGVKHPWALGASAREVWAEIWPDIGPRIEKVMQTGEATWDEALMLFLERSGYTEETYHTFSYSPLSDDDDSIAGMLCVVTEETERVIGERRLALLREVASALAPAQTQNEVFAAIKGCLEANPRDLPFTLTYLFEEDGHSARLQCATGIPAGHPVATPILHDSDPDLLWPLQTIRAQIEPIVIADLAERVGSLPSGPWDRLPEQGIVVPLAQQGQTQPAGFLAAGVNPYRRLDAAYIGFVGLLAGQMAARLANARAYENERRRAEALAELDRAKTTFFSNVSHEFRTPLTLMLGPVEDALASPERALQGENLDTVHRNSIRLLKLVNTLLDFSRIEAGRVQAVYEPVDLSAFTAELAGTFRSAVEKAGLELRVHCPPLTEPVYVDRDMWEKIVLNLLSNAFKFTFEGHIDVALQAAGNAVVLSVTDTGIGIPEAELPHIFDRFHRVEGNRGRTHEGTGIGLALVQELARLHGGEVAVQSIAGQGTTFTVTIPFGTAHLPQERISAARTLASTALRAEAYVEEALRWLPDAAEAVVSSPYVEDSALGLAKSGSSGPRARIVLADDNADMRDYARRLLQGSYEVEAVADGAEALAAIRRERPDLVLSDIMMPHLDGFGLLAALRSDPQTNTIPIVLLSARAGEESRVEGLEAGADDYLTKPFSARELLATVKAHLELARLRQEAEAELRARQEEIEALNARLRRSIRETHHRVKNNLQLTAAMVDMQAMEQTRPPSLEDLQHLSSQIRTLAAVHDLLTSHAAEDGEIGVISGKAVLEKLLKMLQMGAQADTLRYTLEDCLLPGRQANALALLTNELVSNAQKHGRGHIEVTLSADGTTVRLEVSDDGPGFPEEFDPEMAAHTGLMLVESLARMDLRGSVRYENAPGGGGRVRVAFPQNAPGDNVK